MLFTRTPSGLAAKPLFVYVRVHTDISYRPSRQDSQQKKELKLDWIGGLKEYRDQYTALELQKKALDWRD